MKDLAIAELARYDWKSLHVMGGRSDGVPSSLRGLIEAATEDDALLHYWDLENVVVVQGQLFEAAPPVVSVIVAELSGELSNAAGEQVFELLFQIVSGESHEEAVARGNSSLGEECRARAKEGLWDIYKNLNGPFWYSAKRILDFVETDKKRLLDLTVDLKRKKPRHSGGAGVEV